MSANIIDALNSQIAILTAQIELQNKFIQTLMDQNTENMSFASDSVRALSSANANLIRELGVVHTKCAKLEAEIAERR